MLDIFLLADLEKNEANSNFLTNTHVNITGINHDIKEAMEEIDKKNPDLVFVDLKLLESDIMGMLHFVNAKQRVVFMAAKNSVFHKDILSNYNIEHVVMDSGINELIEYLKKIDLVACSPEYDTEKASVLCHMGDGRYRIVWFDDILRMVRTGSMTTIDTNDDRKRYCRLSITQLEKRTNNPKHFRINRSCILNRDIIDGYMILKSGNWEIFTKDDHTEMLSRRRVQGFKQWLEL